MPLSLLSLLGGGGGVAGVDGLTGELMLLFCSSSGQSLFEKILKKKIEYNMKMYRLKISVSTQVH